MRVKENMILITIRQCVISTKFKISFQNQNKNLTFFSALRIPLEELGLNFDDRFEEEKKNLTEFFIRMY